MLRFLARFVAVILAIVFVIAAVVVVFFRPIGTEMARARYYKEALAEERLYTRFPAVFGETMRLTLDREWQEQSGSSEKDRGHLESFRKLEAKDWETLLGAVAPAPYLQREVEGVLETLEAFLHSDAARPTAVISLAEMKTRLAGPAALEAYTQVLSTKPLCTNQQFAASGGLPVACRPSPDRMPEVLASFGNLAQSIADQIPATFEPFGKDAGVEAPLPVGEELNELRTRLKRTEEYARLSPVVPAILLLLVGVFAVRGIRGLLLWWGVPCLIAGLISLMIALPTMLVARFSYLSIIKPQLPPDVPVETAQAVFDLFAGLMGKFMALPVLLAAGLAIGGLVAMILSAFFKGGSGKPAVFAVEPPVKIQ